MSGSQDVPSVPDYALLRVIGRGAYGEIWLARGLTGALRAVKIVRRNNFESERTFNREFEGIASYEPVSLEHPGLVDVLHVGRRDADGFFYYVMELADDRSGARKFATEAYEPRTLKSVLAEGGRLPLADCLRIGLALAEGLGALHDSGLVHRDVKPANVIFVNGQAKLADIGLVASTGQHSFVGTEGYVPPEGPGTVQADLYALGKVLYEIAMGKDRMQFPEVATRKGDEESRESMIALNQVLLRACATVPAKRYETAAAMREDLASVQAGRRVGRKNRTAWFLLAALLVIAALIGAAMMMWHPPVPPGHPPSPTPVASAETPTPAPTAAPTIAPPPTPTPPMFGSVKIISSPRGATVWHDGEELGVTPLFLEEVPVGPHKYVLKLPGYEDGEVERVVEGGKQEFIGHRLDKRPSLDPNVPFVNSLGMTFVTVGDVRFCTTETRVKDYDAYCAATGTGRPTTDFAQDENHPIVNIAWRDAVSFCEWLTAKEQREGVIGDDMAYRLPTDLEWSIAAGLTDEGGDSPEARDGKRKGHFPWGETWPPPPGSGNFADAARRGRGEKSIPGYDDAFVATAPVGSFPANMHGLFDMAGNVWEWCQDSYRNSTSGRDWGVLRGGSWGNASKSELLTSYRNVVDREERDVLFGFRCVLAGKDEP